MTDEDVIALHNGTLEAMEDLRLGSDLPALEMPVGRPSDRMVTTAATNGARVGTSSGASSTAAMTRVRA